MVGYVLICGRRSRESAECCRNGAIDSYVPFRFGAETVLFGESNPLCRFQSFGMFGITWTVHNPKLRQHSSQ